MLFLALWHDTFPEPRIVVSAAARELDWRDDRYPQTAISVQLLVLGVKVATRNCYMFCLLSTYVLGILLLYYYCKLDNSE